MATKRSAGLLMFRRCHGRLEVLLVHPGGPYWTNRDAGAWSIPKGEVCPGEDLLATAKREFAEETGIAPEGEFIELPPVRQKGGKLVFAWAFEGDCDPDEIESNWVSMKCRFRPGEMIRFPEVDKAAFFDLVSAQDKINPAQTALLEALEARLADPS